MVLYLIMFVPLQVEQMSIELEDAKTKVAQFQKQCEEFLVVIVQQKRDADEQQKVTTRYWKIWWVLGWCYPQTDS